MAARKNRQLAGQVVGMLTIVERVPYVTGQPTEWLCKCECGEQSVRREADLVHARVSSCGCRTKVPLRFAIGQRIGKLVVMEVRGKSTCGGKGRGWFCKCDCGSETLLSTADLAYRDYTSCGCDRIGKRQWRGRWAHETVTVDLFTESKGACLPLPGPCEFHRCRHFLRGGGCSIRMANDGAQALEAVAYQIGFSKQAADLCIQRALPKLKRSKRFDDFK